MLLLPLLLATSQAMAQSEANATVTPTRMGLGAVATLSLTLHADEPASVLSLVTDLPEDVEAVAPLALESDCPGSVTFDAGVITHALERFVGTCTTTLDITSTLPGIYTFEPGTPTGPLLGEAGTTATLTVDTELPTLSLSAAPLSGPVGARRRVDASVDIPPMANAGFFFNAVTVTAGPNSHFPLDTDATFSCSGATALPPLTVTRDTLSARFTGAPGSCSLSADVELDTLGTADVSAVVTQNNATIDRRQVTLSAPHGPITVQIDDARPSESAMLHLTATNRDRSQPVSDISGTIDLDALLPGLVATGLPSDGGCGATSQVSGTSQLTLSGLSLDAGAACTLDVALQVPASATPGTAFGTTSAFTGVQDGPVTFSAPAPIAIDVLTDVSAMLTLTPSPVGAGQPATLSLTLNNGGAALSNLGTTLPVGAAFPPLQLDGTGTGCGASSSVLLLQDPTNPQLLFTGLQVDAEASCTLEQPVILPRDVASSVVATRTEALTAQRDGADIRLAPATATADVVGAPDLRIDLPVTPGTTATWAFEVSHSAEANESVTDVAFTATLDADVVPGTPTLSGCGGGTASASPLSLSGATLAPGDTCVMTVPVTLPETSDYRVMDVTVDGVSATTRGVSVLGPAVTAQTTLNPSTFTVSVTPDVVRPGSDVSIVHRIEHAGDDTLQALQLLLPTTLLPEATLVSATASAGCDDLVQTSTTRVTWNAASIPAGTACELTTVFTVAGTPGEYTYAPPAASLTHADGTVEDVGATAVPVFLVPPVGMISTFLDPDPLPGGTTTLRHRLINDTTSDITGLAFTQALDAVLLGLARTGAAVTDVCGVGSEVQGTDTVTVSGVSLLAGTECVLDVSLAVPVDATSGSYALPTSSLSFTQDGAPTDAPGTTPTLTVASADCRPGFELVAGACIDIDECALGTDVCADEATCANTDGSYNCACDTGYDGDGLVCTDIDECALLPCADDATCTNTVGDFDCACDEGRDGDPFLSCEPICGDGLVIDERCDDGNLDAGDGCDADCVVEDGWACMGEPSVCAETCGDGVVDETEECDDGADNALDGDCLPDCTVPEPIDTDDTGTPDDGEGCSCNAVTPAMGWMFLPMLLVLARRRR